MKILYISAHAVLEYDEILLLTELEHEVFSLGGAYMDPMGHPSLPRPGIPGAKRFVELEDMARTYPRTEIPSELIELFDTVIIMDGYHALPILRGNWERFASKKIVLRMIGQSIPELERVLRKFRDKGLNVLRYSPIEEKLDNYAGADGLIRFYKDPNEFGNWSGHDVKVINMSQSLKGRRGFCGYDFLMKVGAGFPFKVYGSGNEDLSEFCGGDLPYDLMKGQLRDARVYLYGGTWPASYTLSFIEAWMTGIPVVSVDFEQWKHKDHPSMKIFEVPKLISHGDNGFVCTSVDHAKEVIRRLLDDYEYAKKIGEAGRSRAIELFGKEKIKEEWKIFLEEL